MDASFLPWSLKHAPSSLKSMAGQDKAIGELRAFLAGFPKKRAALLHGPIGSGKTLAAHLLAREHEFEVLEVNASDCRDKEGLLATVGRASQQRSLFGRGKIIIVDEVDSVSGRNDRGAIPTIVSLIEKSPVPLLLTANDISESKMAPLVSKCHSIEFHTLSYLSVANVLRGVCTAEGRSLDDELIKRVARRSGGDARAAINDLQVLCAQERAPGAEDVESLADRFAKESIVQALMKIFKTTDLELSLRALDLVDEDLDEVFLWVDENLPREYVNPQDCDNAYRALSCADVFRARIVLRQEWHFLVYANALLTAGVTVAKSAKYPGFSAYRRNARLLRIWQLNQKYAARKAAAQVLAPVFHVSSKRMVRDVFPLFVHAIRSDKALREHLVRDVGIDLTEIASW